jgi:hypothetical protein
MAAVVLQCTFSGAGFAATLSSGAGSGLLGCSNIVGAHVAIELPATAGTTVTATVNCPSFAYDRNAAVVVASGGCTATVSNGVSTISGSTILTAVCLFEPSTSVPVTDFALQCAWEMII